VTLLVRRILGHVDDEGFVGRRRNCLAVASDEARRRRFRAATADGVELALDLTRGSFLFEGAVLHDDGEVVVVVERALEAALVVRLDLTLPPETLVEQAARVAHWAGNQHLLVETEDDAIRVRVATTPELTLEAARTLDLPGAQVETSEFAFARDLPPAPVHAHV
jgi:urease accessory protein